LGQFFNFEEVVMPKKKARQARERRRAAPAAKAQAGPPDVPTVALRSLYQMLCDVGRLRPSIRRTTDGRYAIVIGSKKPRASKYDAFRVILPTDAGLMFGTFFELEAVNGCIDVRTCRLRDSVHFGSENVLGEVIQSAWIFGTREGRHFADAIAAINSLNEPQFAGCGDYFSERLPDDVLDEVADRACEPAFPSW
jgi:hypothetical protein